MYQLLNIPKDREFDLREVFTAHGVQFPQNHQFTYIRHWLTRHGFGLKRIHGLKEYWISSHLIPDPDREKLCTYTEDIFAAKFFPAITRPLSLDGLVQIRRIMRSRGLVKRSMGYWSYKAPRRAPVKRERPKVNAPKHVRVPKGAFTLVEFLDYNLMRRYPENFAWAREELKQRGIESLRGTGRYVRRNARGELPPQLTGNWSVPPPNSLAFTTHEFQVWNNAKRPTSEEWKSALDWLAAQGYRFDPTWKRWRKDK